MPYFLFVLLLWAAPAWAFPVDQLMDPRPAHRLLDQANMLTVEQEEEVEAALGRPPLETVEILLVTTPDVGEESPKNAAHRLFNRWGIGPHDNNGILILMVLNDRRVEVEVGTGMETRIPDATVSRLLQETAVPHFKKGAFSQGFVDLIEALAQEATKPPGTKAVAPPAALTGWGIFWVGLLGFLPLSWLVQRLTRSSRRNEMHAKNKRFATWCGWALIPVWLGGLVLDFGPWGFDGTVLLAVLYTGWYLVWLYVLADRWEKFPPQCSCGGQTVLLTEAQEDPYLTQIQQLEEKLKNVDYWVYLCVTCDRTILHPKKAKTETRCPKCKALTIEKAVRTIRTPTHTQEGLNVVTRVCLAPECGFKEHKNETVPSVVQSSGASSNNIWDSTNLPSSSWDSGSSSSSDSFDSGSSSGGGAGADW